MYLWKGFYTTSFVSLYHLAFCSSWALDDTKEDLKKSDILVFMYFLITIKFALLKDRETTESETWNQGWVYPLAGVRSNWVIFEN